MFAIAAGLKSNPRAEGPRGAKDSICSRGRLDAARTVQCPLTTSLDSCFRPSGRKLYSKRPARFPAGSAVSGDSSEIGTIPAHVHSRCSGVDSRLCGSCCQLCCCRWPVCHRRAGKYVFLSRASSRKSEESQVSDSRVADTQAAASMSNGCGEPVAPAGEAGGFSVVSGSRAVAAVACRDREMLRRPIRDGRSHFCTAPR